MSATRKATVGVALVAILGAGVYTTVRQLRIQGELEIVRRQHAFLAERLEHVQSQRDEATNLVATLREENQRLSAETVEIPKLRAEVTRLNNRIHAQMNATGRKQQEEEQEVALSLEAPGAADLDDDQKEALKEWIEGLMTKNSVDDLDRLKDTLSRWDELFMNSAPANLKSVFAILKGRLKERIKELEEKK